MLVLVSVECCKICNAKLKTIMKILTSSSCCISSSIELFSAKSSAAYDDKNKKQHNKANYQKCC